jgi:hypothetical protein
MFAEHAHVFEYAAQISGFYLVLGANTISHARQQKANRGGREAENSWLAEGFTFRQLRYDCAGGGCPGGAQLQTAGCAPLIGHVSVMLKARIVPVPVAGFRWLGKACTKKGGPPTPKRPALFLSILSRCTTPSPVRRNLSVLKMVQVMWIFFVRASDFFNFFQKNFFPVF